MNNKVKIIAATLAVGMAATLAGCGGCGGCAGCNNNTSSSTLTRSNWYTGTSYNGIQPSFIEGHEKFSKEEIVYDVTFDGSDAGNGYMTVDYKDGKFSTEFYAVRNWSSKIGSAIPEGFEPEKADEVVYYYRTELTISVQYTLKRGNKDKSDWFEDHMVTESYFRAAGKSLQPVYSRQDIKSTSPANYQPVTLQEAYQKIEKSYENFYNDRCSKVLSITYDENGQESERKEYGKLNKLERTLFDNSSLYIAARSLKLSSGLSESVNLFSAAAGSVSEYAITGSGATLDSTDEKLEIKHISKELQDKGLFIPTEDSEVVSTVAININYAGGNLHGTTQTVWYAALPSDDNAVNVSRATLLKLSIPISFSLGTLNYSLKEIKSTLWNG